MTTTTEHPVDTRTLEVPGAVLAYDVRGDLAKATESAPALLMAGTPMTAEPFSDLAKRFDDRPVITYDPRNTGRSRWTTGTTPTPEDHASDLHAIISALRPELGSPKVDLLGSSGGAINGLALAIAHPEDLRTLVAHEPPSCPVLPDADVLLAACRHVLESYDRAGFALGMATFIALTSAQGPQGPEYLEQPDPDPAMFGMPTEDDGSRDDPLMRNMATIPVWGPDLDALRRATCRVVLGYGNASGETLAARAPRAMAAALGTSAVAFPGDHMPFMSWQPGVPSEVDAFATVLREVLG